MVRMTVVPNDLHGRMVRLSHFEADPVIRQCEAAVSRVAYDLRQIRHDLRETIIERDSEYPSFLKHTDSLRQVLGHNQEAYQFLGSSILFNHYKFNNPKVRLRSKTSRHIPGIAQFFQYERVRQYYVLRRALSDFFTNELAGVKRGLENLTNFRSEAKPRVFWVNLRLDNTYAALGDTLGNHYLRNKFLEALMKANTLLTKYEELEVVDDQEEVAEAA